MKGKAMIERSFAPSFRLSLAAKDAGLVQDAAERYGLDLPMLRAIRDRLDEGKDEHGDEDMSATYLTSAPAVSRR
jgi:3-hydroxyisobutyrate dehydrogenase